tara:strand:+ start:196 stop:564 length:369 start_codon:yes stop_codon:yes gene_type:complete
MADLKIPNLNKNSDKFFFKKKLSLRRKSKRKLINESFFMLSFSGFLIYIIFIIPNKLLVFNNLSNNFDNLMANIFNSIPHFYEISLAIFIVFSLIFSILLILGAFSRLRKVLRRKSRHIAFK